MSSLICQKFENKLEDLIATRRWVNTKADVARYCNVKPQTVSYWCETETLTQLRIKQLEELFALQSGQLILGWSEFKKTVIDGWVDDPNPWKRLLIEADPHSIMEIFSLETKPALPDIPGIERIVAEDEPDDEPQETYRRGERIYLRMELPSALKWATQAIVLSKLGDTVLTVCPSRLCPETAIAEPVLTLPKDINGTVFKTTGDGLQSLVTIITAQPLSDSLCQHLHNEASKLSEEALQKLAVEIKGRPERERHVYRRDYRVQ